MPTFSNIDELKHERNNISYNLSEKDRLLIEQKELYKKQQEELRLKNVYKIDDEHSKNFNKIHKLLLN